MSGNDISLTRLKKEDDHTTVVNILLLIVAPHLYRVMHGCDIGLFYTNFPKAMIAAPSPAAIIAVGMFNTTTSINYTIKRGCVLSIHDSPTT